MSTEHRPPQAATPEIPKRQVSLDAYRGFIMVLLVSGAFGIPQVAAKFSEDDRLAQTLAYQFEHVKWTGCSLWDLIQPSFMFMVGVAIPFSYASRRAKGDSTLRIAGHVVWRSLVLIFLGIFLVSNWGKHTNWTFVNVLTQIGLGYGFVYLLVGKHPIVQLLAVAAVLGGYWYVFASYELPNPNDSVRIQDSGFTDPRKHEPMRKQRRGGGPTDDSKQEQPAEKNETHFGVAAHWTKNANFASDVDAILLKYFPNTKTPDPGGYATLNFVPSMVTMLLGLMAGELLRRKISARSKFWILVSAGLLCLLIGVAVDHYIWPEWLADGMSKLGQAVGASSPSFFDRDWTVCPIVKRIWTPSWVVFSAGWTFLMLAAFYLVIDVRGWQRWAFPFVVVGMNSIAIYCMSMLLRPWIRKTLEIHLGENFWENIYGGTTYVELYKAVAILAFLWLVAWWMYRRKIFIRI
jgi:predicted acyltransferase